MFILVIHAEGRKYIKSFNFFIVMEFLVFLVLGFWRYQQ